ncbi:MAG: DNA topoisomerase 3, partial [Myxococcales bacterium]
MAIAVVAEKPSVARDIASVLGAKTRGKGFLEGNGYIVTWAVGHLVGLCEPDEIDSSWKPWRLDRLPMLPRDWPLKVLKDGRDQFHALEAVLNSPKVERVVCATDAGREGELIFRHIYKASGCNKPVDRLWISSLTPDAIRKGFQALRPARDFDGLGAAAEARSRADWLVGMNFSRAYTLRFQPDLLSVGRVQTPTLAMLVEREKTIEAFVPEEYCEVVATFEAPGGLYTGVWFDPKKAKDEGEARLAQRLPPDAELASAIRDRCAGKLGEVVSVEGEERSMPPPLLYDLTELQRHANRLFGMTAKDTLAAAQALYEKHKLLSYPRTDSRHLSSSVAGTLGPIVESIAAKYGDAVAPGTGARPLSKRYVDDSKVTDHHAIIPTGVSATGKDLGRDEERLYDLVCRRLLMAWHKEHRTRVTRAVTLVRSESAEDRFRSSGTVVTQVGWKALDIEPPKKKSKGKQDDEAADARLPDGLDVGQRPPVTAVEVERKKTSPPRRFTDATLLTAMESAGRALDNRELEEAMRERGLGTPATRAAILETLLQRGYVERQGKSLRATAKGIALIDVVHDSVKSPSLTGEWELKLKQMEHGEGSFDAFMCEIERYVIEIVGQVKRTDPASVAARAASGGAGKAPAPAGLPLFDRRSAAKRADGDKSEVGSGGEPPVHPGAPRSSASPFAL